MIKQEGATMRLVQVLVHGRSFGGVAAIADAFALAGLLVVLGAAFSSVGAF